MPGPPSTTRVAARPGADDRVLVGRDGAQHVAHPSRPAAAEAGDERRLVVERGVSLEPVRGEHLVPVVGDPAAGPAVPASARQACRVGVRGPEERFRGGRAPVDEQPAPGLVGEAEPPDVHRLGTVGADHPAQAQVQAETPQQPQPGAQPVDLLVALQALRARLGRRPALGVEPVGQVRDRLLEALREGREVLLVPGDQRRVGLGGEVVGKVERRGGQWGHR